MADTAEARAAAWSAQVPRWMGTLTAVTATDNPNVTEVRIRTRQSAVHATVERSSPLDRIIGLLAVGDTVAFTVASMESLAGNAQQRLCGPSFRVRLTGLMKVPYITLPTAERGKGK